MEMSAFIERLHFSAPVSDYNPAEAAIHTSRYLLAREQCRGKRVLDVSCGEGYGSFLMAKHWGALSVDGIDISPEAIEKATRLFGQPNIRFIAHDAENMTEVLEAGSYDLVVSLETIEHVPHPDRFLDQIKRLLKPTGTAIVSCPNDHWYYPDPSTSNPFHLRKYRFDEFRALIESHLGADCQYLLGVPVSGFGNYPLSTLEQRNLDGVADVTLAMIDIPAEQLNVPGTSTIPPQQSSYFVATWRPGATAVGISASVYPRSMDEHDSHAAALRSNMKLVDERDAYIKKLEARVDEYTAAIRHMDQMIRERNEYIAALETRVNQQAEGMRSQDQLLHERKMYIEQLEKKLQPKR